MKTFVLALALGAAMAGAHASEGNYVSLDAQRAFRGTYDLDNGKSLSVSQHGHKLYAQVDDGASMELVATADGIFTSVSGSTRIEFRQTPNGSVAGVILTRATN